MTVILFVFHSGMIDRKAVAIRESKIVLFCVGVGSVKEEVYPQQWSLLMEMLRDATATIDYRKVYPKGQFYFTLQTFERVDPNRLLNKNVCHLIIKESNSAFMITATSLHELNYSSNAH